jgi:hypothetical protein
MEAKVALKNRGNLLNFMCEEPESGSITLV